MENGERVGFAEIYNVMLVHAKRRGLFPKQAIVANLA